MELVRNTFAIKQPMCLSCQNTENFASDLAAILPRPPVSNLPGNN